jgi:hypothetical protein
MATWKMKIRYRQGKQRSGLEGYAFHGLWVYKQQQQKEYLSPLQKNSLRRHYNYKHCL